MRGYALIGGFIHLSISLFLSRSCEKKNEDIEASFQLSGKLDGGNSKLHGTRMFELIELVVASLSLSLFFRVFVFLNSK